MFDDFFHQLVLVLVFYLVFWSCVSRPRHLTTDETHHSRLIITSSLMCSNFVAKGPFIATQATQLDVEWSWVASAKSLATPMQLNSTSSCPHVHSVNNCHLSMNVVTQLTQFVGLWRHKQKYDWLRCTLFNWVSWVELSCVAVNGPLSSFHIFWSHPSFSACRRPELEKYSWRHSTVSQNELDTACD